MSACSASNMRRSRLITPLPGWAAKASSTRLASAISSAAGRKGWLAGCDLAGMDERSCRQSRNRAPWRRRAEILRRIQVVMHAVQHGDARGARRQHAERHGGMKIGAVGHVAVPRMALQQVIAAQHQAVGAGSAMAGALNTARGVSIIAQMALPGAVACAAMTSSPAGHLGQQDGVGAGPGHRLQVGVMPRACQRH